MQLEAVSLLHFRGGSPLKGDLGAYLHSSHSEHSVKMIKEVITVVSLFLLLPLAAATTTTFVLSLNEGQEI